MSSKGSTFYINYYEYENKFDLKQLQDNDRYAARDIERLEKEIEKLREYRKAIFDQAQIVANTEMKTIVKIYRQHYDNVQFFISVYTTPIWEDVSNFHNHIIGEKIYNERFPGKERHNVIRKAQELTEQYKATLIKNF